MCTDRVMRWGVALAMVLFLAPIANAEFLHARVSYEGGGSLIKGNGDADWSFLNVNTLLVPGDDLWADNQGLIEVETPTGVFVRMADGSKGEIRDFRIDMPAELQAAMPRN